MIVPPVLGFLMCFYLWLGLNRWAKVVGFSWLALGALYGIYVKRRSCRLSLGEMSES